MVSNSTRAPRRRYDNSPIIRRYQTNIPLFTAVPLFCLRNPGNNCVLIDFFSFREILERQSARRIPTYGKERFKKLQFRN